MVHLLLGDLLISTALSNEYYNKMIWHTAVSTIDILLGLSCHMLVLLIETNYDAILLS